ncbi:MAG: hypothetical protein ACI8ZN_001201 [Bacteroidia bacterium]|jgi:uncharacterized protein (DUF1800 family)
MITSAQSTHRTQSGLATYSGSWTDREVRHLLRRTMFGAQKGDIDYFEGKSMSDAVDELLALPSALPDPPVNNYNSERLTDPDIAFGDTWVNGPDNPGLYGARTSSIKSWWLGRMVHQERNILEKMVLFWHNHFATEVEVYRDPIYAYHHFSTLRLNALGDFKSLVKLVTVDMAMLTYLNGNRNTKNAPDENYARELQELFTLGKGPDSEYTENDVREAARVLTGFRINRTDYSSYFDFNKHDTGDKTFSGFFNNASITGKSGINGASELDDLLDIIFSKEEVSKFICRKLYRWFVYYDIDAQVESDVIEPLAAILRTNNYNIKKVLEALLKSEHFFDVANEGCMVKSPLDSLVGLMRITDTEFPAKTDLAEQYYFWQIIWQVCASHQQHIGEPPNVAGWPAYYQYPQFSELWINTDTLPKRNQISDVMIYTGLTYKASKLKTDTIKMSDMMDNPSNATALVQDLVNYCYSLDVSTDQKTYMKGILLAGQIDDSYWADAWNDYKADPTNATKKSIVETRLNALVKYIMNLAEFQLS